MSINVRPNLFFKCHLDLSETQARALEALAGYSDDAFIQMFYTSLGKHYMEPYEEGMRAFLVECREQLRPQISVIDEARAVLKKNKL